MTHDPSAFVERAGLTFEAEGLPRMAGRILGHLMICDPPEQSIADLMDALKASNGSISTMTRYLENQGYIQRISVPGARRDYFALRSGVATEILASASASLIRLGALFEGATALANHQRDALKEAHDLFTYLAEEYPALIQRWQQRRSD